MIKIKNGSRLLLKSSKNNKKNLALVVFNKALPVAKKVIKYVFSALQEFFEYNFTQKDGGSVKHFIEAVLITLQFFFNWFSKPFVWMKAVFLAFRHALYYFLAYLKRFVVFILPYLNIYYCKIREIARLTWGSILNAYKTYLTRERFEKYRAEMGILLNQSFYFIFVRVPTEFPVFMRLLSVWVSRILSASKVLCSCISITLYQAFSDLKKIYSTSFRKTVNSVFSKLKTIFVIIPPIFYSAKKIFGLSKTRFIFHLYMIRAGWIDRWNETYFFYRQNWFVSSVIRIINKTGEFASLPAGLRGSLYSLCDIPGVFSALFCSTGPFCSMFRLFKTFCIFSIRTRCSFSSTAVPFTGNVQLDFDGRRAILWAERFIIFYTACIGLVVFWLSLASVYRYAFLLMFPVSGPSMSFAGGFKDWSDRTSWAQNTKRYFIDFTQYFSNDTASSPQANRYGIRHLRRHNASIFQISLVSVFFERFSQFYRSNILPINVENWVFFSAIFLGVILMVSPSKTNEQSLALRYYWFVRSFWLCSFICKLYTVLNYTHNSLSEIFCIEMFTINWSGKVFSLFLSFVGLLSFDVLRKVSFNTNEAVIASSLFFLILNYAVVSSPFCSDGFSVVLFVELVSFCGLGLIVLNSTGKAWFVSEWGLKYIVFNLLGSNLLYAGFAISYMSTSYLDFLRIRWFTLDNYNQTVVVLCFIAFLVKVFSLPTSILAQSVYSKLPAAIAQVFGVLMKAFYLVFILRFWYVDVTVNSLHILPIGFICVLSVLWSAVPAVRSYGFTGVVFYSSLQHAACIVLTLICGATQSSLWCCLFYVGFYIITATFVFVSQSNTLHRKWFLEKTRSSSGDFYLINLLSLAGLPPFVGFFAKLSVFGLLMQDGFNVISCILGMSSIISTMYYSRWVSNALFLKTVDSAVSFTFCQMAKNVLGRVSSRFNTLQVTAVTLFNALYIVLFIPLLYNLIKFYLAPISKTSALFLTVVGTALTFNSRGSGFAYANIGDEVYQWRTLPFWYNDITGWDRRSFLGSSCWRDQNGRFYWTNEMFYNRAFIEGTSPYVLALSNADIFSEDSDIFVNSSYALTDCGPSPLGSIIDMMDVHRSDRFFFLRNLDSSRDSGVPDRARVPALEYGLAGVYFGEDHSNIDRDWDRLVATTEVSNDPYFFVDASDENGSSLSAHADTRRDFANRNTARLILGGDEYSPVLSPEEIRILFGGAEDLPEDILQDRAREFSYQEQELRRLTPAEELLILRYVFVNQPVPAISTSEADFGDRFENFLNNKYGDEKADLDEQTRDVELSYFRGVVEQDRARYVRESKEILDSIGVFVNRYGRLYWKVEE